MTRIEDASLSDLRELVGELAVSEETHSFLFIAQHRDGFHFSMPMVGDVSGQQEAALIAQYIAEATAREESELDREEFLRTLVEELNDRRSEADAEGGVV